MRRWQCHELICGAEPIVMSQVAQRLNSSLLGLFCQHIRYDLYYSGDSDSRRKGENLHACSVTRGI